MRSLQKIKKVISLFEAKLVPLAQDDINPSLTKQFLLFSHLETHAHPIVCAGQEPRAGWQPCGLPSTGSGTATQCLDWTKFWYGLNHGMEFLDTGLSPGPDEDQTGLFVSHGRMNRDETLGTCGQHSISTLNKSDHESLIFPYMGLWNTFLMIPWNNTISTTSKELIYLH